MVHPRQPEQASRRARHVADQSGKKHHVRVNDDGSLMSGRSARRQENNSSSTTK
jgi:hypothetical protein